MTGPARTLMRYHGGKWRLAPWVISFFPEHRVYVEPFGGAASVLMRKPRSYAEIYNELSPSVVNIFRVLRDPATALQLRALIELTPFARIEFAAAYEDCEEPVEWARRCLVRAFMGFGSGSIHDNKPRGMRTSSSRWRPPTGFRSNSNRSGTTPAYDWANWPDSIDEFTDRLRGVVIEQRDALAVIATHDDAEALHYVDPPYPHITRNIRRPTGVYRHEMTDEDHRLLATVLHGVKGMVVLSGYACPLYDEELYPGWERHEHETYADGAKKRTEVLWLNPACSAARHSQTAQHSLLEVAQ